VTPGSPTAATDPFFQKQVVETLTANFLRGTDSKDPLASPLFADLSDMPPMYVQVGGDEGLLGDAVELGEAAQRAGVDARASRSSPSSCTYSRWRWAGPRRQTRRSEISPDG
jgi:acetyl esterase/lipase